MKIARVNNLTETIKYLREQGIWVYGTDIEAKDYYYNQNLTRTNCNSYWKRRLWHE